MRRLFSFFTRSFDRNDSSGVSENLVHVDPRAAKYQYDSLPQWDEWMVAPAPTRRRRRSGWYPVVK